MLCKYNIYIYDTLRYKILSIYFQVTPPTNNEKNYLNPRNSNVSIVKRNSDSNWVCWKDTWSTNRPSCRRPLWIGFVRYVIAIVFPQSNVCWATSKRFIWSNQNPTQSFSFKALRSSNISSSITSCMSECAHFTITTSGRWSVRLAWDVFTL